MHFRPAGQVTIRLNVHDWVRHPTGRIRRLLTSCFWSNENDGFAEHKRGVELSRPRAHQAEVPIRLQFICHGAVRLNVQDWVHHLALLSSTRSLGDECGKYSDG